MKNYYIKKYGLSAILIVFCLVTSAQDTLTVDSNNAEFGLLNNVIAGDTTEEGERAHDVYRLLQDQTYILSGAIENRFPLTIVAEEGDGERPRLVPGVPNGGSSSRPFRARDNLTLKGLFVTGQDELGALNTSQRIIRISATGAIVRIDNCHLDQDGQSCFRTDSDNISIFVNNSIISNIGRPNNTNNGRLIDDRGSNLDTVIIENSTIYNISSTMINDRGGWIKYSRINQNTIAHTGQRIIDFVECQTCIFTNNLVINPGYLGTENDTIPDNEAYLIEFDTLSELSLSELPADVTQTFTFTNNNIFLDSAILEAYPQDPDNFAFADWPVEQRPLLEPAGEAFAGEEQLATNIVEIVRFTNAPPVDDLATIVTQFWTDPNDNDFKESVKPWDISDEPFNFRYQDSFESATASTTDGPLGSPQWELILTGIGGLRQSIAEAEDLLDGAEAGQNIGQYRESAIVALTEALNLAQEILADPSNSPEEFEAAKAALDAAIADFQGQLITGVFNQISENILIYPNPSSNYIKFVDPDAVSVEIWTISGRLVGKSEIKTDARLSVRSMVDGTYILRIRKSDDSIETVKFIKE